MRYHAKIIFILTLRAFFTLSVMLLTIFGGFLLPFFLGLLPIFLIDLGILLGNSAGHIVMAYAIVLTILIIYLNVIDRILEKDSSESKIPVMEAYLTLLKEEYDLIIDGSTLKKEDNFYMKEVSKIVCGINKYHLIKVDDENKSVCFERRRK